MNRNVPYNPNKLPTVVSALNYGFNALLDSLSRSPPAFAPLPSAPIEDPDLKKSRRWLPTGWRRLALMNIVLVSVSLLLLVSVLAYAASVTGGVGQSSELHTTDCKSAATINTLLHLLINALSAGILASSNFFMQVLNAPSRREVDKAHTKGSWLDIGVPSARNAFNLSWFKCLAWLSLLLTSVPIHMLFNSTIFLTDNRMGDFHVSMATESFIGGGPYFLPGASLLTITHDVLENGTLHPPFDVMANYFSAQSTETANAAANASGWEALEKSDCANIYQSKRCTGLTKHGNLVLTVNSTGWKRSDTWNLSPAGDEIWEPYVPREELNTLWFSTQCSMQGTMRSGALSCEATCDSFFDDLYPRVFESWNKSTESENDDLSKRYRYENISSLYTDSGSPPKYGSQFRLTDLEITSCLVEPKDTTCTVALSEPLLLAIVLSVLLKVVICISTVRYIGPEEPLVTLGDAMASFISVQNRPVPAFGSIPHSDTGQRAQKIGESHGQPCGTQQWKRKRHRRAHAISTSTWILNSAFWLVNIAAIVIALSYSAAGGSPLSWEIASKTSNFLAGQGFISSILIANIPQLYFSLWYLAFNALVTRMEMAREWDLFSITYCPLRVTRPKAQQVSTYRLQLAYKYSIPLIIISALSHWLLSNALFVVFSKGTYYELVHQSFHHAEKAPPEGITILSGSSSSPIAYQGIIWFAMVVFLVILSKRELTGYMPTAGSNSLAIMAACQVSPLAKVPVVFNSDRADNQEMEIGELEQSAQRSMAIDDSQGGVKDMVFCLLKWGEVKMPEDWYLQGEENGQDPVQQGHLSFGTVMDDPKPPTEGRWYR